MFTRRHYKAIAEIMAWNKRLADQDETDSAWIVSHTADDLADCFTEDNPRFDRERFLKACGL